MKKSMFAFLLFLLAPNPAAADTFYVNCEADRDDYDGRSPEEPFKTIQRGADALSGGDELVVAPCVYFEQPIIWNPGSDAENPVWIRANPLGEATISGMWEEAALGADGLWQDEGDGVYSAEHGPALFGSYEGTFLFRRNSLEDLRSESVTFYSDIKSRDVTVNMPDHGFACEGGRIYVKLSGGVDPSGESILFSPPTWGEEGELHAVLEVAAATHVIIDGFRIEGSGTNCVWINQDSTFPTVRNTVLSYCVQGLRLPDDSIVEWSEYVYPGFYDFAEYVRAHNEWGMDSVYMLVKEYHSPVMLEGGLASTFGEMNSRDCVFRYNFMHETFDGEALGEFQYSESHHNVYMYNYDNHVEMESWRGYPARYLQLHHSLMLGCPMGPISHQDDYEEGSITGPQFIYRNVIYYYDDHGWPSWTQIKSKAPIAAGGIFYYNNILWGGEGLLFWETRENLVFRNNIMIFETNADEIEPDVPLDSDYNILVNSEDKAWLRGEENGLYVPVEDSRNPTELGFLDHENLNFGISDHSPAKNRGVEIEGITDYAPEGSDIGPFETVEDPGTEWPRPRRTVFTCDPPIRWRGPIPDDYCPYPPEADEDEMEVVEEAEMIFGETVEVVEPVAEDISDDAGTEDEPDAGNGGGGCGCRIL